MHIPHMTGQDTHITKVLADIQVSLAPTRYTSNSAKFYLLGLVYWSTYMCVVPLDKW